MRIVGPALVLPLVGLGATVIAWRAGGGADARLDPPRPEPAPQASALEPGEPGKGDQAYEVKTRLVDALGGARIDIQNLGAAQAALQASWRRVRGPWSRLSGVAGQLVTTIALRTSAEETQWAVSTQDGGTWTPEARIWNMNEGSYEQRESIFAPGPSTLAFHMTVPLAARLRIAPGLAAPSSGVTRFDVEVVDATGLLHTVSETRIEPGDARAWHDLDLDLGAWGGQPVDLVLQTSSESASPASPSAAPLAAPLALWGDPVIVAMGPTHLPYDVLWIVVDALRPDVAAGLHDEAEDRAKRAAPRPPLEALLPAVPGLLPSIDGLASRGVHFTHAWSAAAWTRPGTLAMLTGERSSELGLDTTAWVMPPSEQARYYASDPPLLPLLLRRSGALTAAFVNNFFMSGYSAVGVDMGFERLTDHRYRTRDTGEIQRDALAWLDAHKSDRFFLFVNFNSPHEPYDPLPEMLARIPAAPNGTPLDPQVRSYMAEGAKDDAAIGALLDKIESLGRTRSTLVVVTADHGETLSSAHQAIGLGGIPMRFHHAVGNFEETTRIPIVMALPGVLEGGAAVADRVRNVDIAPTVLDAEGLEADPRMSGRSMLPLVRGKHEPDARVVISEGRASRALLWGPWRLVVHDPAPDPARAPGDRDGGEEPPVEDELYDLVADPGERHNVAHQHPYVITDLKARLSAGLANVPVADAQGEPQGPPARLCARFAGGGQVHRVTGSLTIGDGKHPVTVGVDPEGIAREALRIDSAGGASTAVRGGAGAAAGPTPAPATGAGAASAAPRPVVDFAFPTVSDALVGFDLRIDPPGAPVTWQLFLDDAPWPDGRIFAGPFGLPAVAARTGIDSEEAREELYAPAPAPADPERDLGVFFTRDALSREGATGGGETGGAASSRQPGGGAARAIAGPTGAGATGAGATGGGDGTSSPGESAAPTNAAAAREMQRMLEQWGYAHPASAAAGSAPGKPPARP